MKKIGTGKNMPRCIKCLFICNFRYEPLLIGDMSKHPTWKSHPRILDGTGTLGYAGFPVINKDNYALGTLCMLNKTPKSLDTNQVDLLKKITANIALLLDLRIEQKEITSEKILNSLIEF